MSSQSPVRSPQQISNDSSTICNAWPTDVNLDTIARLPFYMSASLMRPLPTNSIINAPLAQLVITSNVNSDLNFSIGDYE